MTTTHLAITPYEASDAQGVCTLINGIQRAEFGIDITVEDQPDLLGIPEFYQWGCGNFWVARDGSRVAGTIALLDIGHNQAVLRKMFVHRDHRGTGAAKALLSIALDWARVHETSELLLGTTPKFLAAHRFYEKNGFVEIAKDALPDRFPVMEVDTKFYSYSLA